LGKTVESGSGEAGVLTTTYDKIFDWARRSAAWPLEIGLGCCAAGTLGAAAPLDPRHDMARFGPEVFRAAPRQSDLLIIAGPVSHKMAPVIRRIWDQMPAPKWSIALGECSSCGGGWCTYAVTQGLDRIIPVDLYVSGCPPRPEDLLQALLQLQPRISAAGART
jgi:NADH-quinone oxidoreductase subunit B